MINMQAFLSEQMTALALGIREPEATLGQQQHLAAMEAMEAAQASAFSAIAAVMNRLDPAMSGLAESSEHIVGPQRGEAGLWEPDRTGCPYCRRRTYLVRLRPLGNLTSIEGRCTNCGTKGWQWIENDPAPNSLK